MATFTAQLRKFGVKSKDQVERVRRESIIKMFDQVAVATPVDTGRLRGNWQCTINSPAGSVIPNVRAVSAVLDEVKANLGTPKDTVYFTNNLVYAEPIEFGHSAQAPQGMVRKNAAMWPQIVEAVVRGSAK